LTDALCTHFDDVPMIQYFLDYQLPLEAKPDYIVILAWNDAASILKREAVLQKAGVRFIVPIPFSRIV
jgi:C-methyltransferase C-terminal domain